MEVSMLIPKLYGGGMVRYAKPFNRNSGVIIAVLCSIFVWLNNMLSRWRASRVKEGATTNASTRGRPSYWNIVEALEC